MPMREILSVGRELIISTTVLNRDELMKSVLHLSAGNTSQQGYTFFSILLRNPDIRVNLQDYESGYTALHRALFVGNIRAARDLLARHDIDLSVKDAEGLTAFDLYNGTVDGVSGSNFQSESTDHRQIHFEVLKGRICTFGG